MKLCKFERNTNYEFLKIMILKKSQLRKGIVDQPNVVET